MGGFGSVDQNNCKPKKFQNIMCLFKKTPWDLENDINKNEGNGIFTSENVFDYVPSVAWNSFRQDIS